MKSNEYMNMYVQMDGEYILPQFFAHDDGTIDQQSIANGFGVLATMGFIQINKNGAIRLTDAARLRRDYPDVYRLMINIHYSEVQATLDELIEMGHAEMIWSDEDEDFAYVITDKGRAAIGESFS